jgi:hypothetical protein
MAEEAYQSTRVRIHGSSKNPFSCAIQCRLVCSRVFRIEQTRSNLKYSTSSVQMQRRSISSDPVLAQILRQSERRHMKYDRNEVPLKRSTSQKSWDSKIEEMDWELCLRRYFDYVDSWHPVDESSHEPQTSLSRRSSFHRSQDIPPLQRQPTNASLRSNYGEFRRGEDLDTSQFYRQPRRRSSSVHSLERQGTTEISNTDRRSMSMRTNPSTALVLYGSPARPESMAVSTVRPIRHASISGDFHWEYIGKSSTFSLLSPLTARWPELKDAQVDIYTQTQNMTANEARAYAQGRLASLPPEITDEVRRALSHQTQERQSRSQHRHTIQSYTSQEPGPRRSSSLDTAERSRYNHLHRPNSFSPSQGYVMKPQPPIKTLPRKPIPQSPSPGTQKKGFLSLGDLRPLTAISERPSTSKSKASSLDRPASRSFIQSFMPKKSNLSTQVLSTVPDKEATEGRSSSGSDTLTSNRDVDVDSQNSPRSYPRPNSFKSPLRTQKPLPPKPFEAKPRKTKLFAMFRRRQSQSDLRMPLPPSVLSLQSAASINQSRESLRGVSMDLLKRKDSKVTLLSVAENLDVPFDIWLRALPYIEGRVRTPGGL